MKNLTKQLLYKGDKNFESNLKYDVKTTVFDTY